jgi:putative SOS response-associated peptidase YedK
MVLLLRGRTTSFRATTLRLAKKLLVIRQNRKTGERSLDLIKWGLIPYWCTDPKGGRKPINAKAESVSTLPMFRDAYRLRRCIVPVDGFFEWRAIKGARAKQPYAIAMKDGSPFGLAGLWENWKNPKSGDWERTFAIITVPSNELVAQIHNRMPAILEPAGYDRWLSLEPDPHDLLITYPSEPMTMWPISTRVNKPALGTHSTYGHLSTNGEHRGARTRARYR